ncbi:MAG: NUDIX domain-containing protein [Nitrospinota bacterium]
MVDINDRVIGKATRREIHQQNLCHRSIHVLVFDSKKRIFLQKRSLLKDENPGLWDTSSAGHVDADETYDQCAHRELMEELGIRCDLKPVVKIKACPETYQEHVQVYICKTDATIKINPEEISEGKYFDWDSLQKEIQMNPDIYTSSLKLILRDYSGKILSDIQKLL